MAFHDIPGNPRVKKILKKALQMKRIPNSLLFAGPEGVGMKEMALVLAKAHNCEKMEDDSCDTCASCRATNQGNFPDVMVVKPSGSFIKIEQIRRVKQLAYLKPMVGRKRIFIVDEAEKMNDEAANSFLKILEEPPALSHFILVTTNLFLIIPTIKSRCQLLSFSPVSKEDIEKILVEKGYEKDQARLISLLVHGNLERALSLEWGEIQEKRKEAWQHFLSLIQRREAAHLVDALTSSRRRIQREEFEEMLEFFSSFCRDIILVKEKGDPSHLLNPDLGDEIRIVEKLLSLPQLVESLREIDFAVYALHKYVNMNMLVSSFFSRFLEGEYA